MNIFKEEKQHAAGSKTANKPLCGASGNAVRRIVNRHNVTCIRCLKLLAKQEKKS